MRITVSLTLLLLVLLALTACNTGSHKPVNLTPVSTVCADVAVTDFQYTSTYGLNPMTGKFELYYSYRPVGSHLEQKCRTIYVTPTPLPTPTEGKVIHH